MPSELVDLRRRGTHLQAQHEDAEASSKCGPSSVVAPDPVPAADSVTSSGVITAEERPATRSWIEDRRCCAIMP
jgi:hypothetical protein